MTEVRQDLCGAATAYSVPRVFAFGRSSLLVEVFPQVQNRVATIGTGTSATKLSFSRNANPSMPDAVGSTRSLMFQLC